MHSSQAEEFLCKTVSEVVEPREHGLQALRGFLDGGTDPETPPQEATGAGMLPRRLVGPSSWGTVPQF